MELNEMIALAEQFKNSGGDFSAFITSMQTMAASNKTPLGLNQWQSSDKPVMKDFNEDNRIIDQYLRELMENKADRQDLRELMENKADRQVTGTWVPASGNLNIGRDFAQYELSGDWCYIDFDGNYSYLTDDGNAAHMTGLPVPPAQKGMGTVVYSENEYFDKILILPSGFLLFTYNGIFTTASQVQPETKPLTFNAKYR